MTCQNHIYPVYVSTEAIELLGDYLQAHGDPATSVLRQHIASIVVMPTISIEMWWALLNEIHLAYPTPALGLEIGRGIHPHKIGLLGYILLHCETVEQAIFRFNRFEPLLHNLAPSFIERTDEGLTIFWQGSRPSTRISDEVVMAAIFSIFRLLVDDLAFTALNVEMIHSKPDDVSAYENYFACPVIFDAPRQAVTFSHEQIARRIKTTDPYLMNLLEQQANALLQASPHQDEWLTSVQQHITATLQYGAANAAVIAQRMGLSERSFYRYLRYRGLTFQALLNQVRFELAKDYLKNNALSMSEIAYLLGYSEQSVFSRAFHTWAQTTPLKYRKQFII